MKKQSQFDVLCIGMMVADIIVQSVESFSFTVDTTCVNDISIENGGDALNTAIVLATLGNKVRFIGKAGEDVLGRFLLDKAKITGIDATGIQISQNESTATSVVLINKDGNRVFIYNPGANNTLAEKDIDLCSFANAKIIHVGAANVLPGLENGGLERIFQTAKRYGKITTMDVTWDSTGRWLGVIESVLPFVDYFMPSIEEAKHLANEQEPDKCAEFLLERGVKNVIIKLGDEGCLILSEKERYYIDAFMVENVVDTTGAGDNFTAGFLAGLRQGWLLSDCGLFACATSAICVQQVGATTGVESFNQVYEFFEKNKCRS